MNQIDLSFVRSRAVMKRMALITVICAAAGVVYALAAPKWYRSVLSVMPVRAQRSGLSSMLSGELGGLAAGLGASLSDGADVNRISAVLSSIAVTDAVIDKFDLKTRYDERYQESAREALWKHCSVQTLPKPSLVQLSCEDRDPRFAQRMLEYFAEHGNEVFSRVNVSSASEQVRSLEKRLVELRSQANASAARMREFQEQHGIVDIDTQTKAVVSALATLNTQRISKQLDLEYARTYSSDAENTTKQIESQLAIVEQKLRSLENEPRDGGAPGAKVGSEKGSAGLFPAALAVPKLRAEYETLFRDRKVSEAVLIFALERLETAKADEAREISTFLVLDPPALATRPARPRRSLSIGVATALGVLLSLALEWTRAMGGPRAVAQSLLRSRRTDPELRPRPGGQRVE